MFKGLKKLFGGNDEEQIFAPMLGKMLSMQEVPDPTFSEEMLGPGIAVMPQEGKLYAPADGVITLVFGTLHAVAMTTSSGAELLFHLGLDTVKENGAGFTAHVKLDQAVKKGDLLLSFDKEALEAKGYNLITPMILTNKAAFSEVKINKDKIGLNLNLEDVVLSLTKA